MRAERSNVPDAAEALMAEPRPVRPAAVVPAAEHPVVAPVRRMRPPAAMADLAEMRAEPEVAGVIEYYDHRFIRLTRDGEPNLFIFKHDIKYIQEEA